MKAIFKREFKNFFITPIGYIFIGFFMLMSAIMFVMNVMEPQIADLSGFFASLSVVLVVLVPILTMRLLAEEKRNKTDQLLFTAPVTMTEIVLGKFFATAAIYGLVLVCTWIFPIIMMIVSKPVVGIMISQYVGFFLLGLVFISIGLYISALTENQIISAIASFGILLVLVLLDSFAANISIPIVANIVSWLSITARFEDFFIGILNPAVIIYYLSITALFVYFTIQTLEKRRFI